MSAGLNPGQQWEIPLPCLAGCAYTVVDSSGKMGIVNRWFSYKITHRLLPQCDPTLPLPSPYSSTMAAAVLRRYFLGSTGILHNGQCQNDAWLMDGNPNAPQHRDLRMIVQGENPQHAIIYFEFYNTRGVRWEVTGIPNGFVIQSALPGQAFRIQGPTPVNPVNPHRRRGVIHPMGFDFDWDTKVDIRYNVPGGNTSMWYIKHKKRRAGQQYQSADPTITNGIDHQVIEWGTQINEYRHGWR